MNFYKVEINKIEILGWKWKSQWNLQARILETTLKLHWIMVNKTRLANP